MESPDSLLALHGGRPIFPEGPPRWPLPSERVRAALEAAYRDGGWGVYAGPRREALEAQLAELTGRRFAWSCCSGTLAIELALRGLKIGAGDEVVLAGYDFGGSFRAIEAVGARPVLADIDPRTWSLSVAGFEAAIGPDTRAAIVSHLHGGTADLGEITRLATNRGIAVVEDACQTPGGSIAGRPAGGSGEVGVLSFGGSKLLTCGRGGAVVTDDPAILQRIKIYCERGNDAFALSELQAAVLLPQVEELAALNQRRSQAVAQLLATSAQWPYLRPIAVARPDDRPAYYKLGFAWQGAGATREQWISAAQAEGLALDAGFLGFTRRPTSRCRVAGELPNAKLAAVQTVVLHHPILLGTPEQIQRVVAGLLKLGAVTESWR